MVRTKKSPSSQTSINNFFHNLLSSVGRVSLVFEFARILAGLAGAVAPVIYRGFTKEDLVQDSYFSVSRESSRKVLVLQKRS